MNILFIHGNYPAQFRYLAPLLAQDPNHKVIFLTNREDAGDEQLRGVNIRNIEAHRPVNKETHHYLISAEESVLQGQSTIRSIIKLIDEGFVPDIVIYHAGMGFGFFTKDLLPRSIHIGYFEWYFQNKTTKYLVKEFDFDTQLKSGMRNIPILKELQSCDYGIVPTEWQKQQFPNEYKNKLRVIFDGVDIDFIKNNHKTRENSDELILTYGTRGMEAVRCFPQFIEELPDLLNIHKNMRVQIAGEDKINYGGLKPSTHASWKLWAIEFLKKNKIEHKVEWMGRMSYEKYIEWLCASNIHVYLSHPFVPSWSFIEAQSAGCNLICTDHKSLRENVFTESIIYVAHNDRGFLLEAVNKLSLRIGGFRNSNTEALNPLQALDYDVKTAMSRWFRVTGVDVTTQA